MPTEPGCRRHREFPRRPKAGRLPQGHQYQPTTLTTSNFALGSKNAFAGADINTVRDTASAAAGDATANVTEAFTTPVQRLVLIYSNDIIYMTNVLRQQTIDINLITKGLFK